MAQASNNVLKLKTTRYKFAVYGYEHPTIDTKLIGHYRWKIIAKLAAWWFKCKELKVILPATSWVREIDMIERKSLT